MKRVGILTLFYKTYNFGAQLQAYALQRAVQKMGYECEQIRFTWSTEQTRFNYDTASVDQAGFETFARQIPHSRRIYTPENLDEANREYDIFICGSDQIWGVGESMPAYVLPQMALSFVRGNKKKIAYGASFGSGDIAENRKEILRCFLNRLDFVSVREPSAVSAVEAMTGKPAIPVLDPVFLLSAEEWRRTAGESRAARQGKRYVLLYNVSCSDKLYRRASDFAEKKALDLVNLAYIQGRSIGPCDFISLIKHADYVITDSFHGSVLSVLFHKQFLALGVDSITTPFSKNVRITDMLMTCGLKERFCLGTEEDWSGRLERPIDYREADRRISSALAGSKEFLENALSFTDTAKREYKTSQLLWDKVVNTGMCTGCTACTKCRHSCITMGQDELGFWHPVFNHEGCADCGQCLNVCPCYPNGERGGQGPKKAVSLAFRAKDEALLRESSSGGAFSVIGERFIEGGGVVYGAAYDSRNGFKVEHGRGNTKEELRTFRKSKYVQSDLGSCFSEIERQLTAGKSVLFTGTPCQAAGLKAYLQKDYEKLYTMDLICGGVTSPLLWKKYVDFYREHTGTDGFDMRFKGLGFFRDNGKLAFSISHKRAGEECFYQKEEDLFMSTRMAFYNECCYHCDFKGDCHDADITIGDFVGFNLVMADKNDNKGISLVLVRSSKGEELLERCRDDFIGYACSYDEAAARNEMIGSSMRKPAGSDYLRGIAPVSSMEKVCYESRQIRLFQEKEYIFKNFIVELKRNELLMKIKRYTALQCKAEYDPVIKGRIVIYGAGKIGRALIDCTDGALLCFLDRSEKIRHVSGYSVYRPESAEFGKLYEENRLTVLVTPVWDYWEIREGLADHYPRLNIVPADKLVEKIWE